MRKFRTVLMRSGTSIGYMFRKEDLPENREEWNSIFLTMIDNSNAKQINSIGGSASSNRKIVVVWKSQEPNVDVEYLVGHVIADKNQVDYKSDCGNMAAAVGPFSVEEGMVDIVEPITTVHILNRNTDKYINETVPIKNGTFSENGDCSIEGVDGTGAELIVQFINPAGAKAEKLLPTGNVLDVLEIYGAIKLQVTILDVSNPMVIVRAEDIGLKGTELPEEINKDNETCDLLERIRGTAACIIGSAKDSADAEANSPTIPQIGIITVPKTFTDITGNTVKAEDMDVCARVMSIFKCNKSCPLTSANSISAAAFLEGSIMQKVIGKPMQGKHDVRIGHPSGVMTVYPEIIRNKDMIKLPSIGVKRTARRIMDGNVYIK